MMARLKLPLLVLLPFSLLLLAGCSSAPSPADTPTPTPAETTLTTVGQKAPDFTVTALDGGSFTLSEHLGKVVLVNWFATWCPPCQAEMPHLQKEVWEEFAGGDFVMISVAREEKPDVVTPFVQKFAVTWPFTCDPDRTAYARYAEAFIPRNHVIGRDGTIVFQSEGFEEAEFGEMVAVIRKLLGPN